MYIQFLSINVIQARFSYLHGDLFRWKRSSFLLFHLEWSAIQRCSETYIQDEFTKLFVLPLFCIMHLLLLLMISIMTFMLSILYQYINQCIDFYTNN